MSNFSTLKSLCHKITDGSHYSPKGESDGFPMLSVKDMTDFGFSYNDCKFISEEDYQKLVKADCRPKLNDLLIAKDGSYLKHVFVIKEEKEQAVLSSIGILRPNLNKVNPDYLKYYLQTKSVKETVSKKYVSGSALPRIILKGFEQIAVLIKDLPTQQSIAKVLSDLDAKIELNNRINRELEAMAKTLYDYWFVQFDFPNANGKPYKSSGGKMVYNAELKREIPEGWAVKQINTKVKIGSGFPFNSDDYSDTGKYKIITIKNVQEGYLETSSVDYVSFLPNNISDFCILKEGDILMSLTGNVGRMCFVDQSNLLLNQRVGKLLGEKDFVTYAYFFFKRPENQKRLEKIAGGSSQANLSPIDAVKDKFPIPTAPVLNNFTQLVNPLLNQILIKNQENQHLAALRDWLLPMLMNGQVTVRQAHGNAVKEAEEKLSMAAEPSVEYKKG